MGNTASKKFEEKSDATEQKHESPVKKQESEKTAKKSPSQDANSGWFGGIFSKLSMKPKNQMILPDDKNPAVST